jgi:hypothetical protein
MSHYCRGGMIDRWIAFIVSGNSIPFGMRADHYHFALSSSLRPAESESCYFPSVAKSISGGGNCATAAFLRPIMESMGVKYRPEVSLDVVIKDTVVNLTGVSVSWLGKFSDRSSKCHQHQCLQRRI